MPRNERTSLQPCVCAVHRCAVRSLQFLRDRYAVGGAKKEAMRRAAAYLRVSTGGQTVESQRGAVARAAAARGDKLIPGDWFVENASGKTLARPALDRLRKAVRAGHVSRVYVFRLDRLSRGGARDMFEVVDEMTSCSVELVSVEGVPLDGPAGRIVVAVLAELAHMELESIGQRVAAGIKAKRAKGGRWGRPGRLDAATLRKALAMQKAGRTQRAIAIALKVPRSTLQAALAGRGHYRR